MSELLGSWDNGFRLFRNQLVKNIPATVRQLKLNCPEIDFPEFILTQEHTEFDESDKISNSFIEANNLPPGLYHSIKLSNGFNVLIEPGNQSIQYFITDSNHFPLVREVYSSITEGEDSYLKKGQLQERHDYFVTDKGVICEVARGRDYTQLTFASLETIEVKELSDKTLDTLDAPFRYVVFDRRGNVYAGKSFPKGFTKFQEEFMYQPGVSRGYVGRSLKTISETEEKRILKRRQSESTFLLRGSHIDQRCTQLMYAKRPAFLRELSFDTLDDDLDTFFKPNQDYQQSTVVSFDNKSGYIMFLFEGEEVNDVTYSKLRSIRDKGNKRLQYFQGYKVVIGTTVQNNTVAALIRNNYIEKVLDDDWEIDVDNVFNP